MRLRILSICIILVFLLAGCDDSIKEIILKGAAAETTATESTLTYSKEPGKDSSFEFSIDVEKTYPHMTSLLIQRHGEIIFEGYYKEGSKEHPNQIRSVTKSVLSVLTGIAINEGFIKSADQKIVEYFPEYVNAETDPGIKEISLRNLLNMTSGIPYDLDLYREWLNLQNPIKSAFESELDSPPGSIYKYNDAGVHILSGIITKATKMSAEQFAEKYLFKELGIEGYYWPSDRQGNNIGVAELTLKTVDMAKIGQLYLDKGNWKGKQLVSPDWVKESTIRQSDGGIPEMEQYGYLWWVTKVSGHAAYFAAGYGGQYIYVVPDMDVVVVITSDLSSHHGENRAIVPDYIIPALN